MMAKVQLERRRENEDEFASGDLPMVIGAFAMGVDEFIVAGVVEEIAQDLSVTIGAVGLFESAYAIGVAVGAPLFTALGLRVPRRQMLLLTTTVFLVSNLVSALGPTYRSS
ncbi:MAG: hypothetical protein CYG60_01670 [Actinobacteria bacterium]|nr:MAG: hypothetical protein CYG60_01670 [Actinomycetota bacterium]